MTAQTITIGKRAVGEGSPPYVIAEACVNHQGRIDLALEMVYSARAMGADAIKFQLHEIDDEMLRNVPMSSNFDVPLFETLEQTNLTLDEHRRLRELCERIGIQYLCTPFSKRAADLLVSEVGIPVFKVGSGELTNLPFQRHMARKGLPMIVSTGMSEISEIDEVVALHKAEKTPLALTHCVSIYPCPYDQVNLGFIPEMRRRYNVPVGLSCHTPSIYTSLGAVALGASIIEKHFTFDRSWTGPDHKSSIEPYELGELVKGARAIFEARGNERRIFEKEREIVAWARESVVTETDISAGQTITAEMVTVKRPSPGPGVIPAKELDKIIGKKAVVNIPKDTQVLWEQVD